MKTTDIHEKVLFAASPDTVYNLLMNEELHARFTGADARVSMEEGGTLMAYDGYITGKNLELVPGEKIVQLWRAEEEGWPEHHWSTVTFNLARTADGNTLLHFTQTGLPAQHAEAIRKGWSDYYWEPMQALLDEMD